MSSETFVDGLSHIRFSGGAARLDFVANRGAADGKSEQVTLILTQEGFLAAYQTMQKMVMKLAEEGKVTLSQSAAQPQKDETA